MRDATEGVQVFGGAGSGKTSCTGYTLGRAYLQAQVGGLILCAKPEERVMWENSPLRPAASMTW